MMGTSFLMRSASQTQIHHWQRIWLYVLCGLIVLFLVLPALIVIPMSFSESRFLQFPPRGFSFRWYTHYFTSLEWQSATIVSFRAAFLTALVATPIGTAAAYWMHVQDSRYVRLVQIFILTPLLIPVILIAIGIFFIYAKLGLNSTTPGLVIAHSALAVPYVFVTVLAGLKSYDLNQERVARSLGAHPLWAFFTVTLPQIRFSVISGALLAFITSLDEVVIALFISGGDKSTLTKRMFNALRDEIDPTVAAISTLLIVISVVFLVASQTFGRTQR